MRGRFLGRVGTHSRYLDQFTSRYSFIHPGFNRGTAKAFYFRNRFNGFLTPQQLATGTVKTVAEESS